MTPPRHRQIDAGVWHTGIPWRHPGIPRGPTCRRIGMARGILVTVHDDDDAVDVVGHDDERVHHHVGPYLRRPVPFVGDDVAVRVSVHAVVDHVAEKTGASAGAYRDEIRPGLRVIIPAQADGLAVVFLGVVRHTASCFLHKTRHLPRPYLSRGGFVRNSLEPACLLPQDAVPDTNRASPDTFRASRCSNSFRSNRDNAAPA